MMRRLGRLGRHLWRALLDAVFPPKCLLCSGDALSLGSSDHDRRPASEQALRSAFCQACLDRFSRLASPYCTVCGQPFVSREGENHRCGECLERPKAFGMARAFGPYEGPLMDSIHHLKYGRKRAFARPLGSLLESAFEAHWEKDVVDLLVPVPLHVKRLRKRGFNQTYLLTQPWAKRQGIACDGMVLCRVKRTLPQTGLNRKERQANIRGAFAIRRPERVVDKRVVLVDDVYTTGATVNECARVLMAGGAESVDVLTLARAV